MQVWASRAETFEGPMISMVGTDLSMLEADQALMLHLEEQQKALREREHELTIAHDHLASDLEGMSSLQRIATQFVRGADTRTIAMDALDAAKAGVTTSPLIAVSRIGASRSGRTGWGPATAPAAPCGTADARC